MFVAEPASESRVRPSLATGLSVGLAALAVLVFFVYPTPLLDAAERAANVFRV
jgi:hypothetical protein